VAALLGLIVLGERLTLAAVAGLVLVGLALAVLAAPTRQRPRPPAGPPARPPAPSPGRTCR
jgi:DME family drug/metabolite transporter